MASLCARAAFSTKLITTRSLLQNVLTKSKSHTNRILLPTHSVIRNFCSAKPLPKKETVTVHFIKNDGNRMTTKAAVGENLLDVIVENDIDIDGFGACEGTLACSTCHLIFTQEDYKKIGEQPTDEELDMLDLAFSLSDTSRLGCQVIVTKEMDGWEISVPEGVADARNP